MANMSASILRNLVSSVFNVPAQSVVLSGEIAPDFRGDYTSGVSYSDFTERGIRNVWGFCPQTGFKLVNGCISTIHMYNGNHDIYHTAGKPLSEIVEGCEIFFVTEYFSDEDNESVFTVYKAPDFAAHWAKIEESDIKRWEEWLA